MFENIPRTKTHTSSCMNPVKYIFVILCSAFDCAVQCQDGTLSGTVILVYGDSIQIAIAADSRRVLSDSIAMPSEECKIRVFGNNTIFVTTGLYCTLAGFDIFTIARESYIPDSSFDFDLPPLSVPT